MKRISLACLALGLLVLVAACSTEKTPSGGGGGGKKEAGLNQAVRDGKFEFVVKSVTCGKAQVGNSTLGKKAQGQFCLVAITVKNIGNEAQSLFGDNQTLFDTKGRKFSADTEAAIYVEDSKTLYEEINPGNSITGTLIYDVPKDAKPAKIELHDSAFSGGVTVKLA